MAEYLLVYHGGGMPESEQEQAKAMASWGQWMSSLGSDLVDGGKPVGPSTTVQSDGSVVNHGGANPVSGYSLIKAANIDDAVAKAKGCPILASGGSIELAETFEI